MRDNALAIAGLLCRDVGGPPCRPYQPANYYEHLQFPNRPYAADRDERQYRRTVYTHWQRTFLHPMLANFDAPSREDCIALRTNANTPQQALTLLNDPTFVESARRLANRALLENPPDDSQRITWVYEVSLARPPSPEEANSLIQLLQQLREVYQHAPRDAEKLLNVGWSSNVPDVVPAELAAWTNLCRVVLNLHETITRY